MNHRSLLVVMVILSAWATLRPSPCRGDDAAPALDLANEPRAFAYRRQFLDTFSFLFERDDPYPTLEERLTQYEQLEAKLTEMEAALPAEKDMNTLLNKLWKQLADAQLQPEKVHVGKPVQDDTIVILPVELTFQGSTSATRTGLWILAALSGRTHRLDTTRRNDGTLRTKIVQSLYFRATTAPILTLDTERSEMIVSRAVNICRMMEWPPRLCILQQITELYPADLTTYELVIKEQVRQERVVSRKSATAKSKKSKNNNDKDKTQKLVLYDLCVETTGLDSTPQIQLALARTLKKTGALEKVVEEVRAADGTGWKISGVVPARWTLESMRPAQADAGAARE